MSRIKLSICIPTYCRPSLLEKSIYSAIKSIDEYYENVEIIVIDNDERKSAEPIVENIKKHNERIKISYFSNDRNYGLAYNAYASVMHAIGKYGWLVGDDDFILPGAIRILFNVFELFPELEIIMFDSFHSNLKDSKKLLNAPNNIIDSSYTLDLNDIKFGKTTHFIHSKFKNVYLGSMMMSVFKINLWKTVKISKEELMGFNSLKSMYPHVHIFSNAFMNSSAAYLNKKIIVVLDGTRSWAAKDSSKYWSSVEPFIYFRIIHEILIDYRKNGLSLNFYLSNLNYNSSIVGELLIRYVVNAKLKKKNINYKEKYKISNTVKSYIPFPRFYVGMFKGLVKELLNYHY